jgi:hypothetical protein
MRRGAGGTRPRATKASDAELDALIEEATVDAYDETEQTVGFHTMLDEQDRPDRRQPDCGDLHARQVEPADRDPRPAASETAAEGRGMDRRLSPMAMWGIAIVGEIDRDKLRAALPSQ